MMGNQKITVVIPCFRVANAITGVIATIPDWVDHIIVVDDGCPEQSGDCAQQLNQSRIFVIKHRLNRGVGAAVISGYQQALTLQSDIIIKMDGDGQMNGADIEQLIKPLLQQQADYTKGNRFHDLGSLKKMPKLRLFGNSILSFLTKLVSGYWNLMDSTNGFTAITSTTLRKLSLDKLASRYFFETDVLVNLYLISAVVNDVPMPAIYNGEPSNMNIRKVVLSFPPKIGSRLLKRIFYRYFLYDFNMASIYLVCSIPMMLFGVSFGTYQWMQGAMDNTFNSAGTVMLAAMPFILGVQLLLQAIHIDIDNVPKK